jgi:two-component system OmpR family response regulator
MRNGQFFNIESTMPIESSETRDSGRVRQRMPRLGDAPVCRDQLTVEDTSVQTSSSHVLVVDHDVNLCRQLSDYLGKNDFQVTTVNTGKQMLELIRRDGIDLLLLEPGLPGEDGLKLTKVIRDSSSMPLVVLSERHEEADRVMGLELGADDYVTKPFSPRELLARIRAVLRRSRVNASADARDSRIRAYRFAGWELNVRLFRLTSPEGTPVGLSRGEFNLLRAFLSAPQRILTRDQLLELTRLHIAEVYDRTIDVQIGRLRRKTEVDSAQPRFIRTERGAGYYFDAAVSAVR